jgi:hypothetical protein
MKKEQNNQKKRRKETCNFTDAISLILVVIKSVCTFLASERERERERI